MTRPQSIIWFERCYLAGIVLGLIGVALRWNATTAAVRDNPAVANLGAGAMSGIMIAGIIVGLGIKLLLWFGAARKAWTVCKWFIAIFFILGLLGTGFSVIGGRFPSGIDGVLSVVGTVLGALSVWFLFRPDSEVWFGEDSAA